MPITNIKKAGILIFTEHLAGGATIPLPFGSVNAKSFAEFSSDLQMELFCRDIRRRGFRCIGWGGAYALNDHSLYVERRDRHVAGVARHLRNRFHDVYIFALSPDRVLSIERRIGGLGDKKVRVVGVRAAVRHGQPPRHIEFQ
jgi:hypothetical protein